MVKDNLVLGVGSGENHFILGDYFEKIGQGEERISRPCPQQFAASPIGPRDFCLGVLRLVLAVLSCVGLEALEAGSTWDFLSWLGFWEFVGAAVFSPWRDDRVQFYRWRSESS